MIASRLRSFAPCALLASLAACSASHVDEGDLEGESASELRRLGTTEKVGTIGFGETKRIGYSERPLYRALGVQAVAGDRLDFWVRAEGLDTKAWIVDAASKTLATNDDADDSTRDSHVTYQVTKAGTYYVAIREKNREEGEIEVSLAPRDGGPAPVTAPHGFTPGAKIFGQGGGDTTQNTGPSYRCQRKTRSGLACGGWVSLSNNADGGVVATVRAVGHYSYYEWVSGNRVTVPPPANNPIWQGGVAIELDADGHGVATTTTPSTSTSTTVDVSDGGATVRYTNVINPESGCNSYVETCNFAVLASGAFPSVPPY